MTIPDAALRALAFYVNSARPDFQSPGILAALRDEADSDPLQLALRMIHRAADPKNTTPRLQPFDGEGFVSCRRHPGASVRVDGDCGLCFAERNGDDSGAIRDRGGRPIPDEARAVMVAALHRTETADA